VRASALPAPEMDRQSSRGPVRGVPGSELPSHLCHSHQPPSTFILSVSPYCCLAKPFRADLSPLAPPAAVSIRATQVHGGGESCRWELASLYSPVPVPSDPPAQSAARAGDGSTPALRCRKEPF